MKTLQASLFLAGFCFLTQLCVCDSELFPLSQSGQLRYSQLNSLNSTGHTVVPFMPRRCTELSKFTSPSLWNLTVDLVARFSQTFDTRACFHRDEEVWLKSFSFKSFFALKIIILHSKTQLSAWNRSIFFLQDLSSRFELAYSACNEWA